MIILALNVLYILYIIAIRPFKLAYSNIRIILTESVYVAMNSFMLYYCLYIEEEEYDFELIPILERRMVIFMIFATLFAGFLLIVETVFMIRDRYMN